MKIGLMNHLFAPYARGGAEKVASIMLKNYQAAGHEVFLITSKHKNANTELLEKQRTANCKTYYIDSEFYNIGKRPIFLRLFWHIFNLFDFKKFTACQKILNQEKPDLVVTHNLMGLGFMSASAIKLSGAKHHHFLHDIQLLHPSGLIFFGKERILNTIPAKIYQKMTRRLIGTPDLVISPSNWLLKEHTKRNFFPDAKTEITSLEKIFNLESKNNLAKNNLDNNFASQNKKINNQHKTLFFAGQIEKHKGIIFLIKAFKKLAGPNLTLKIAGRGSCEKEIINLIGADKRLQYLGYLNKDELEEELKKSDLLVMPSLCYENSPTIIIEAKNLGVKVIASNLGGIPEIVGQNDILFNPGDERDLFTKINNI